MKGPVAVGVGVAAVLLGNVVVGVWLITRDPADHGLGDALAKAHDGDPIDLRDHVDSEWNRWCVFAPSEVVDTRQVLRGDADFTCLGKSAVGEVREDEVEIAAFRARPGAAPVRFARFHGASLRQREDLRAFVRGPGASAETFAAMVA